MKILLINPPRSPHNAILAHAPAEAQRFIHKKLIGPPLGLLTLAAAAPDHDITVLDMKGQYDLDPTTPPLETLALEWVAKVNPDIVGLTVITSEFNASMRIAAAIKRTSPRVMIIAGGVHATLCPTDFAPHPIDIVVVGQAVPAWREIVAAYDRRSSFEHIAGILLKSTTGLIPTSAARGPVDGAVADFVLPDRSHLKPWISTYFVGKGNGPVTYLFTSLGCPYNCSFCSIWPQFNGAYHQRDVESIIAELKSVDDYPVVRFADANSVVNIAFADRLFDRIEEESIHKEYIMDLRVDTIVENPRLIERFARNGLKVVISGFESYRAEELAVYRKSTSAAMIQRAVDILHANDIMVRGNYVVPPSYDRADFSALADFASSHKVSFAGYTVLTPMPGTQLFADSQADIIDHDLDKYNFFNCVLKTKLPLEEFYAELGNLWTIKKGTDVI